MILTYWEKQIIFTKKKKNPFLVTGTLSKKKKKKTFSQLSYVTDSEWWKNGC